MPRSIADQLVAHRSERCEKGHLLIYELNGIFRPLNDWTLDEQRKINQYAPSCIECEELIRAAGPRERIGE